MALFPDAFRNAVNLKIGIRIFPEIFILYSGYGIYQGLFALVAGIYPTGKFYSYICDETSHIRKIAIIQIMISVIIDIIIFYNYHAWPS